jgi:AraC-like DNA-binding protein
MIKHSLDDSPRKKTRERHKQFAKVVSSLFSQDWTITGPALSKTSMRVEEDGTPELTILRAFTQPMQATCSRLAGLNGRKYFAFTSDHAFRVITPERNALFSAFDVVILGNTLPCTVLCEQEHRSEALIIDSDVVEAVTEIPSRILGRHLSQDHSDTEPLRKIMAHAWALSHAGQLESASKQLVAAFLNYLALLILKPETSNPQLTTVDQEISRSAAEQCRENAKRIIGERYKDPEFTIASLSTLLGVSPRYIQHCFASIGETASGHLSRQRLLEAACLLQRQDDFLPKMSITEIAFSCGFGSSGYFSTEFKRCFGMSPREYAKLEKY